jgi:uncharacterized membrane protein YoaK (UPF0700 family)
MLFRKKKPKFPVLATLLLVLGLVWILNDLSVINLNLPWVPVILVVIAIGMIWNRFRE